MLTCRVKKMNEVHGNSRQVDIADDNAWRRFAPPMSTDRDLDAVL